MDIQHFRKQFNNEKLVSNDVRSMMASYAEVPGRIGINSSGEASTSIRFPVKFLEQPHFKFGLELQEGEGVIPGKFPTGSAFVQEWLTEERLPSTVYYVGARIIVVIDSLRFQKTILNYSFSGTALSNPS